MRKIIIVFFILLSTSCFSQNSISRIFNANEIIFYGYDYSNFKLAEAKRMHQGTQVRNYIFPWIGYMDTKYHHSKMSSKMGINLIPNFDLTNRINTNIDPKDIVSLHEHKITSDSISKIIKTYELSETSGIGFVIIVECFYKATETASAHYVYFDIATREIINSYRFASNKPGGFGLTSFWGSNLYVNLKKYIKKYFIVEKKKFLHKS